MAITPTLFKVRFPEFSTVLDARIQVFIDDSVIVLNETFWGTKYDLGCYYLTAHYLTLGERSSNGNNLSVGSLTGKSVDGVSASYQHATSVNESDAYYASTIYGQRYLALRRTIGTAAVIV